MHGVTLLICNWTKVCMYVLRLCNCTAVSMCLILLHCWSHHGSIIPCTLTISTVGRYLAHENVRHQDQKPLHSLTDQPGPPVNDNIV